MRFLVGGSQGLFLVNKGNKKKLFTGHIYGVSFSQDHVYCCQRVSNGTNIVCLDRNFKQVYSHNVNGGSVHQAHYDLQTGHLFVTITRQDQLLQFDVEAKREVARHKWATGSEHHMNSVWRSPHNGAMYVYEHNTRGVAKQGDQIGGVLRLDHNYQPIRTWEMANKGHNVMVHNGWIYVVNSFDEFLMRKDVETGTEENLIGTSEYPAYAPRGLAFADDCILMGLTELASRKDRSKTREGLVCIYDREYNKTEEHKIAAGQMYEVRLLDRLDHAHNRIIFDDGKFIPALDAPRNVAKANPHVKPVVDKKPEPKPDESFHLFILAMNDSGSTYLQNCLSHCQNCVSFRHPAKRPHGLEGQGASYWKKKNKGWYPRDIDHGVVKVFSEKAGIFSDPKKFNWKEIKGAWNEMWRQNPHHGQAKPKIFLEKTPSSLFTVDMYEKQFPDARFLIMHRNPYVVCEGIRRTVKHHKKKDYSLARCAEHWIKCSQQQMENIKRLTAEGKAVWFKYEDMVTRTGGVEEKIKRFVPAFTDLDLRKPSMCHSMDGNKGAAKPLTNYNNKQLKQLSEEDFAEINTVLDKYPEVMNFFGYQMRSKAP